MDIYKQTKILYDKIAEGWKNIRTKPFDFVKEFAKEIKNKKILDVGCGTGTQILAFDKSNVFFCLDFSKNMIKIAKEKLKDYNAYFIIADARNLPFKNFSFDYVISIACLHHLKKEDFLSAINEIKRVCKGKILISVWKRNIKHFFALLLGFLKFKKFGYALVSWKHKGKKYYRIYYLYTKKELKNLLPDAKIIEFKDNLLIYI